jgi:mannose-1-phosphate guanylyltransferase
VVAHQRHVRYVAEEFAGLAGPRVLMQPGDLGTAAAILLAAHWISWQNPGGLVAVFPSDHFIRGEATFMDHVRAVATSARRKPDRLVLLGAVPTEPEPQYGWIELGTPLGQVGGEPLWRVRGFVEKPTPEAARMARVRGDLWNTFVMVGAVTTLLRLGWEALPGLSERLAQIGRVADPSEEPEAMAHAYAGAPATDFCRAILQPYSSALSVSRLPRQIRWSDWGTPERVIASLRSASLAPAWLQELDRGTTPVTTRGRSTEDRTRGWPG